jgi:hypothetical protein
MRRWMLIATAIVLFGSSEVCAQFVTRFPSYGVVSDSRGNLYTVYDRTWGYSLIGVDQAGRILANVPFGNFVPKGAARLAFDPGSNQILILMNNGELMSYDGRTLRLLARLNLINFDIRSVMDVATRLTRNLGSIIIPGRATWGDLAVRRQGSTLDLYVSGVSIAHAFVAKIRLSGPTVTARVLIASSASTAGQGNQPRGLAVSAAGTGLTSLPFVGLNGITIHDRLLSFTESSTGKVSFRQFSDKGTWTTGIATDSANNFYVAVPVTSALCPNGAIGIRVAADLRTYRCSSATTLIHTSTDFAIVPGGRAFVATSSGIRLLSF